MSVRTAIFDMDGLLLDTERICLETFIDTRRQHGLPDSPEVFIATVGLRGGEGERVIRDSLSGALSFPEFESDWENRIELRMKHAIPLKAGAFHLLSGLRQEGYQLAVATSTRTDRATLHLSKSGLLPFLHYVVGGDQVTRGKPDPEVYHLAARLLGRKAEECFAFEDSDAGTRAAVASGARTVQVPDLVQPSAEVRALGHLIAPSLLEGAEKIGLIARSEFSETIENGSNSASVRSNTASTTHQ